MLEAKLEEHYVTRWHLSDFQPYSDIINAQPYSDIIINAHVCV